MVLTLNMKMTPFKKKHFHVVLLIFNQLYKVILNLAWMNTYNATIQMRDIEPYLPVHVVLFQYAIVTKCRKFFSTIESMSMSVCG